MWERGRSGCAESSRGGGAEAGSEVGWCCSVDRRIIHVVFMISTEIVIVTLFIRDSR